MLDRRQVLIQDEIEASSPVEVIWNFHTRAEVDIHGSRALLTLNSARLELQIASPPGAHFSTLSASPLPPQGQQPEVTNLIIRLPATRQTRLAVGITQSNNEVVLSPGPLSRWVALGRLSEQ